MDGLSRSWGSWYSRRQIHPLLREGRKERFRRRVEVRVGTSKVDENRLASFTAFVVCFLCVEGFVERDVL